MDQNPRDGCAETSNEELIGILTAISVVAKRLAGKLIALEVQEQKRMEVKNE